MQRQASRPARSQTIQLWLLWNTYVLRKVSRLRAAHAPLLIKSCNASGQCKREQNTCPCAIGTPAPRHNTLFGSLGFVIRYLNPLRNTPATLARHQLFTAYGYGLWQHEARQPQELSIRRSNSRKESRFGSCSARYLSHRQQKVESG
jgi:hypothetical protein